jgi:hypothetical protein
MATITTLVDDFTGKPGDDVETIKYNYNGQRYEVDLSKESQAKFITALAPFVKVSRELAAVGTSSDSKNAKVREWAKTVPAYAGQVKDKGRIPDHIVTAYDAAHPNTEASE